MKKRILISLVLAVLLMVSIPVAAFANAEPATPALTIESKNLSVKDTVHLVYDVGYENVAPEAVKLLVWSAPNATYEKGSEATVLDTVGKTPEGNLRFYYKNLTAKQMTDNVYVRAYADVDGTALYSEIVKFSVVEYAHVQLNNPDATPALKTLLTDMLNYGASAQKYFNYKTDRLANASFYEVNVTGATLPDGMTYGLYAENEQVTLTAAAQNGEGKPFSAWLVNGAKLATTATFTYTVKENVEITAAYGALATVDVVNGTFADGETTASVFAGVQVTLKSAKAPNGYAFKYWKDADGNVVGTDRTSTVTVTKDTTYKAYYELTFGTSGTSVDVSWQQGGINGSFKTFNTADTGRVSFNEPIFLKKNATLRVSLPLDAEDPADCLYQVDGNGRDVCSNGCKLCVGVMLLNKNEGGEVKDGDIIPGYTFADPTAKWADDGCTYTATEDVYIMITVKSSMHASVRKFYTDDPKLDEVEVILLNPEDEILAGTYWEAELNDGITKIEANRKKATQGLSEFFYMADTHWPDSAQFSPALVNYIAEKVDSRFVVFAGDVIRRYNPIKQNAIDLEINGFFGALENYTEAGEQLKIFSTLGNHDRNGSSNQPDKNGRLTEQEAYDLYIKRLEKFGGVTVPGDPNRSYYDDTANKVRYVQFYFAGSQYGMVEDGFVDDGLSWAEGVIRELDSDWTVVLITHGVLCGGEGSANEFTEKDDQIIKRILKLQGEADAEIAIWMTGHIHEDRNILLSDAAGNKLRLVSLNADAYGNSNSPTSYKMSPGTVTEQSFSFLQVDTANQMIYLTRFGAGVDLEYGYGANINHTTSTDVDEKKVYESVKVRVQNGTTEDGKTYVDVNTGTSLTVTALDITGHIFSHWVDKDGNIVATTKTASILVTEANTYRPVYTAEAGYTAVANDWFEGSYNGSMTAWAGEEHTAPKSTRLTSQIFTLKAGQTITFTYPKNVTMTNGTESTVMMAYTILTPVEGSNTGDVFTDYTTSGSATWKKTYTNETGSDVLIVFMLKPNDGNGGLNLSNPVLQEITYTIQ